MLWRTFSEGYLNIAFVKYVVSEIRYCYRRILDRSGYFKKLILQHLRQIVKGRMLNVGAFSKRHHQDSSSESLSSGNEF